uniref:Uncharacterized protein n=1 Tax=Picea glauca TaxID=3330 RepID=A0A101LUD2_PICGL|nr:hypothetical protein ABT39_MTgene2624 [Picea glauca]QHR88118.1 hypothetical protein Q903MT_gene2131 [Picea sitchensis]
MLHLPHSEKCLSIRSRLPFPSMERAGSNLYVLSIHYMNQNRLGYVCWERELHFTTD